MVGNAAMRQEKGLEHNGTRHGISTWSASVMEVTRAPASYSPRLSPCPASGCTVCAASLRRPPHAHPQPQQPSKVPTLHKHAAAGSSSRNGSGSSSSRSDNGGSSSSSSRQQQAAAERCVLRGGAAAPDEGQAVAVGDV